MAQLSLPTFSNGDPESWISQIEAFLCNSLVTSDKFVEIALPFLVGDAKIWADSRKTEISEMDWCDFTYNLIWEFDRLRYVVEGSESKEEPVLSIDDNGDSAVISQNYDSADDVEIAHEEASFSTTAIESSFSLDYQIPSTGKFTLDKVLLNSEIYGEELSLWVFNESSKATLELHPTRGTNFPSLHLDDCTAAHPVCQCCLWESMFFLIVILRHFQNVFDPGEKVTKKCFPRRVSPHVSHNIVGVLMLIDEVNPIKLVEETFDSAMEINGRQRSEYLVIKLEDVLSFLVEMSFKRLHRLLYLLGAMLSAVIVYKVFLGACQHCSDGSQKRQSLKMKSVTSSIVLGLVFGISFRL